MFLTAGLLAAHALCAAPQVPDRSVVRPPAGDMASEMSWEEFVRANFDLGMVLPQPLKTDLVNDEEPVVDLAAAMRVVAKQQFPESDYYAYEDWLRSFGDIMRAFGECKHDPEQVDDLVQRLERHWPKIWVEIGPYVREFARADHLRGEKWRPIDDHERDGIYMGEPWHINPHMDRSRYWNNLECDTDVYQAAAFYYADYSAVHGAALDYARYPDDVGRNLEWIHPERGRMFRASEDEPSWFGHEIAFEVDLAFPFGTASCTMRVLDRIDENGTPITEYYAFGEDFHWFAGRDTFLEVRDSRGEPVGILVVSQLGLDLAGAPDGDRDREKILRASLGNWKRVAEPAFRARGGEFVSVGDRLPVLPVTGFE